MIRKIADTLLKWNGDKTSLELHKELRKAYTKQNKLKTQNNTLTYTNKLLERRLKRANNVLEKNEAVLERYEERIENLISNTREATSLVDRYEEATTLQNPRLQQRELEDIMRKRRQILKSVKQTEKKEKQRVEPPKRILL